MDDNIPLKKRKSKYERVESKEKTMVWIREINNFNADGQATLSPPQGPYMLELHLPLALLFKAWENERQKDVPFSSWFYARYPYNHPIPSQEPPVGQNEPQQLNGEQTPYSVNLQNGTTIFARNLVILPRPIIEPQSPIGSRRGSTPLPYSSQTETAFKPLSPTASGSSSRRERERDQYDHRDRYRMMDGDGDDHRDGEPDGY
ncbi:hypothetical protein I203_102234 [Kwoniella mangroviensis CBS 8507]|uniref:uncharacterized protein n=1 Tax=Kwoniella mangroviensis CBS 8507 TaxID=1296122 RepID=UPI00080CCCF2|nr:uncharacterized protein I203_03431 [Kwoniella mangroviensis CBS 8507]OCF67733.1 hypothetical protein I203_03431 [Kwoniella mangroviensis CBS 8507]